MNLDSLESVLSQRMRETLAATDSNRFVRLGKLNALAQRLEEAKQEILRIEAALNQKEDSDTFQSSGSQLSSCDVEISQGDVNQNLFRTPILRKLNLIPQEGTEFEVRAITPNGEICFRTEVDPITRSRLKARSEIAQFYREAGVTAGEFVRWERVDSVTYRMRKAVVVQQIGAQEAIARRSRKADRFSNIDYIG
jgi:hypothetical protein